MVRYAVMRFTYMTGEAPGSRWTCQVLIGTSVYDFQLGYVGDVCSYGKVSHAHIIDALGFGLYPPRQWRPLVALPAGARAATQCEFDQYCAENFDSASNMNAAVWNAVSVADLSQDLPQPKRPKSAMKTGRIARKSDETSTTKVIPARKRDETSTTKVIPARKRDETSTTKMNPARKRDASRALMAQLMGKTEPRRSAKALKAQVAATTTRSNKWWKSQRSYNRRGYNSSGYSRRGYSRRGWH